MSLLWRVKRFSDTWNEMCKKISSWKNR